ncbi:7SK snRNA methylphosphate capping enzyme [Elysia marginata]|uniref:RNA methyltransferase n=1 Tax=Elysia marginata TaxID=1093978 RepID=A0AAV4JRR0_9GAST|nr:7SK snRNA methylphosphate capping enzyme [Elysia marginata]
MASSTSKDEDKPESVLKVPTPEKKTFTQEQQVEAGSESDSTVAGRIVPPQKRPHTRKFRGNQGKTLHPKQRLPPKELRELTRQHALLEKNLKIEGMPAPPKFRKRRLSVGSSASRPHEKDSPYKRKRLASFDARKSDHMPKWELMGGDAQDPLNLNGLADSEEGRLLNLKTPESSPLPTPDFRKVVYVKVPPNIKDPLNLDGEHDQEEIDRLLNTTIKKRHRSKKKKIEDPQQEVATTAAVSDSAPDPKQGLSDLNIDKTTTEEETQSVPEKTDADTVKPKPEQTTPKKAMAPGSGGPRPRSISMSPERRFLKRQLSSSSGKGRPAAPTAPQFKYPEKPKFTQGNYNRYYGYRNVGGVEDPRLPYFDLKWFKGKDVLDVGCNAGHLTLALADQFQPHKILGMDIDGKLIQAARQNIRHILSQRRKDSAKYPRALEMTRGPLEAHPLMGSSDQFPNNVLFLQGNYVPGSEEVLNLQKEEYDTILALSITKWIHLNNGDNGLKLFFRKIFRQLRPGGKLVLEPQPWSTYRKRAKLTPEMFSNYQSIKLKPEGFKHYLLSIGFVKCEVIGVPVTKAKGFRRPLLLFTKQDLRHAASPSTSIDEQDYGNFCHECGSEDKTQCFHPQFTGMRRGPYASYLYDHVNYPSYASSESPLFASTQRANASHSFSNSFGSGGFGGIGFLDHSNDSRDMDFNGFSVTRAPQLRNDSLDPSEGQRVAQGVEGNGNVHSSASSSRSEMSQDSLGGSSRSWSSSMSGSGSGSGSGSTSSTPASGSTVGSASYYSPEHSGLNGEVAAGYNGDVMANVNGENVYVPFDSPPPLINGHVHEEVEEELQVFPADGYEGAVLGDGEQEEIMNDFPPAQGRVNGVDHLSEENGNADDHAPDNPEEEFDSNNSNQELNAPMVEDNLMDMENIDNAVSENDLNNDGADADNPS